MTSGEMTSGEEWVALVTAIAGALTVLAGVVNLVLAERANKRWDSQLHELVDTVKDQAQYMATSNTALEGALDRNQGLVERLIDGILPPRGETNV